MATTYGAQSAKVIQTPATPQAGFVHGSVRNFSEQITLASQAAADITYCGKIPKGAIYLYSTIESDTSLGSTTISIGIVGSTAKYLASGTFTTVDTPVLFGKTAASGVALTADDDLIITWATATAPASGNLKLNHFYAFN